MNTCVLNVAVGRYRLREKFQLLTDVNLVVYMINIHYPRFYCPGVNN